jgi:cytosine/uracil/thiamine/allantoin permease
MPLTLLRSMQFHHLSCCVVGCVAGLAVTSATVVIYGAPVVDPVQLLSHMKQPLAVCVSLFGEWCVTLW